MESTPASHGEGTDFCGKTFYAYHSSPRIYYRKSTGIGKYITIYDKSHVDYECGGDHTALSEYAYCSYARARDKCPRGWGDISSYEAYRPGCREGTYYPHPTQSTNTDRNTGSCNDNCVT